MVEWVETMALYQKFKQCFPLKKDFTFEDCIVITRNKDGISEKHICGVFQDQPLTNPLAEHIMTIAGVLLQTRDSDIRFDGGYYTLGKTAGTSVYLVDSEQLIWQLAWHLRRRGWKYVHISCGVDDHRFDSLQQHPYVPTPKLINIH